MHDYGSADFDDETLAIVEFVEKLTREPSEMTEDDVEKLRQVDLKDEQILSVVPDIERSTFCGAPVGTFPLIVKTTHTDLHGR